MEGDDVVSLRDAYLAMFQFLDERYSRTRSSEVGALLGSMSLLGDGSTADPAIWRDWLRCVEKAQSEQVDALLTFGWREPSTQIRAVLDRLLSEPFPGRDALRVQSTSMLVRPVDCDGSLRLRGSGPTAEVRQRVPVSARYLDGPGDEFSPHVNLLLHVVDGRLHELEVYKDDGSAIAIGVEAVDPACIKFF